MGVFGSSTPSTLAVPTGPANAFPKAAASTYTAPGVTVPFGSLDRWFAYRNAGQTALTRREVVVYGDSTTYGSGGLYSWVQRLRDRTAAAGYADGGKGLFIQDGPGGITDYAAPEVSGFVSSTGFNAFTEQYDLVTGGFYYDAASSSGTLVLQFRSTSARLWYMTGGTYGPFTYLVQDGGTTVASGTVDPSTPRDATYLWLTGLAASTTHTLTITNGASRCRVALAPVNDVGVSYQKVARSGATFAGFFGYLGTVVAPFTGSYSGWIYQQSLGLASTAVQGSNGYAGAPVDTAYANDGRRVKPVLAIADLGFNDLTNSSSSADIPAWVEYVRRFAGACRSAGCDGIIASGQLPYNANWPTYGAARFNALKSQAAIEGLGFVDMFYPIGGASLSYAGGTGNPHLSKAGYQAQADFLWDNLLGL